MRRKGYSRLWYIKKRKMTGIRVWLCISVVLLALILLWFLVDFALFPNAQKGFEASLKEYSYSETEEILSTTLGEDIDMNKLVEIQKDSRGNITAIRTDTVSLTKMTDRIEQALKKDLMVNKSYNRKLLYTGGLPYDPLIISLGAVKINNLSVKYDSSFIPDAAKGTRHKIEFTYKIRYSTLTGAYDMEYVYVIWDNLMPGTTISMKTSF